MTKFTWWQQQVLVVTQLNSVRKFQTIHTGPSISMAKGIQVPHGSIVQSNQRMNYLIFFSYYVILPPSQKSLSLKWMYLGFLGRREYSITTI
jgi:hypothetical protein